MKLNNVKVFALTALTMLGASNANAICLDYWIKGPSACKEQENKEPKTTIVIKGGKNLDLNFKKDEARIAYEQDLDVKIDEFIEGYGKPPREFVAFHLDPSLENAIRWVKKFEDDYDRTRKIAVAWRQADKLFKEYKETGTLKLNDQSGVTEDQVKYILKALEEKPSDLKDVEGFGNDLSDSDWDEKVLNTDYSNLDYKNEKAKSYANAVSKMTKSGNNSDYSLKALEKRSNKDPKAKGEKEKLEISYYFSAKCVYCQKFKPELKKAIEKYGKDNISLTCVDMTPGDRVPSNVKGKLDCKWRPIKVGEEKDFGIRSTPSLLVQRGNSNDLELIENYYDADVVYKYFLNGAK